MLCLPRFGRKGASSRLRTHQFIPFFREADIQVDVAPLISDELLTSRYALGRYRAAEILVPLWERARQVIQASGYDLVWMEKETLPWIPSWIERTLLAGARYVLDIDDATFHRYDQHSLRVVRGLLSLKIDQLMAGASLVTAGNDYLRARAKKAGAPWVEIAPTVVETRRYPMRVDELGRPTRIVWIGSPATARYLEVVRDPLERLTAEFDFVFRVIGAGVPEMGAVRVEAMPWSEATEGSMIAECDIGIMPLPDSPWERGKCAYKLIQYMACGLPTVASPVGANRVVVQEGQTGWFADSAEAWVESLGRLLRDDAERSRLGSAGRLRVEQEYSVSTQAPRLVRLIKQAANCE